MKLIIRFPKINDLEAYTKLLQRTYQDVYTSEEIGLTKECFSEIIFFKPHFQKYLRSNLVVNAHRKTWFAFLDSKLVGSITIEDKGKEYVLKGFYILPKYQRRGIGKHLWQYALAWAKDKDIILDIFTHNYKTIEIYKKWGFRIDEQKGTFTSHWFEWPEGVKATCLYMRLSPSLNRISPKQTS